MYELHYYDHEQDMAHGIFCFCFFTCTACLCGHVLLREGGKGVGGGGGGGRTQRTTAVSIVPVRICHCANEPDLPSRLIKYRRSKE